MKKDWQREYEYWGSVLVKGTDNKEAYSKVLQAGVRKNYSERHRYRLLKQKTYSYFMEIGRRVVENIKSHPKAYDFNRGQ